MPRVINTFRKKPAHNNIPPTISKQPDKQIKTIKILAFGQEILDWRGGGVLCRTSKI
ncbi:hypothetical protein L873DRAFT_1820224, partial [Choiromyces venosus 120613-1]